MIRSNQLIGSNKIVQNDHLIFIYSLLPSITAQNTAITKFHLTAYLHIIGSSMNRLKSAEMIDKIIQ